MKKGIGCDTNTPFGYTLHLSVSHVVARIPTLRALRVVLLATGTLIAGLLLATRGATGPRIYPRIIRGLLLIHGLLIPIVGFDPVNLRIRPSLGHSRCPSVERQGIPRIGGLDLIHHYGLIPRNRSHLLSKRHTRTQNHKQRNQKLHVTLLLEKSHFLVSGTIPLNQLQL